MPSGRKVAVWYPAAAAGQPLLEPARWTEQTEVGRLHDLRATIAQVGSDATLARIADTARVGAVGHSLGGYAVLAMGGAWPAWRTRDVKAVVALSPFVAPWTGDRAQGRT